MLFLSAGDFYKETSEDNFRKEIQFLANAAVAGKRYFKSSAQPKAVSWAESSFFQLLLYFLKVVILLVLRKSVDHLLAIVKLMPSELRVRNHI